jgi:CBS domain-containing protein
MKLKIVPDVIDERNFSHVNFQSTIRDAARYMCRQKMNAVPIMRGDGTLKGIFTDRDITYRVVAPGLNPDLTHLLNVMTTTPETVAADASVPVALHKMHAGRYRHLPVLDGQSLFGMVSISDLYTTAYAELVEKLTGRELKEFLSKTIIPNVIKDQDVTLFSGTQTVREAAQSMADRHVGSILISGDGGLEGIFTESDVAHRVIAQDLDPDQTKLADVMSPDPETVAPDDTCKDVLDRMCSGHFRHLPVVDFQGVRGIASVRDIFAVMQPHIEKEFGSGDSRWDRFLEAFKD